MPPVMNRQRLQAFPPQNLARRAESVPQCVAGEGYRRTTKPQ